MYCAIIMVKHCVPGSFKAWHLETMVIFELNGLTIIKVLISIN